jgi:hypothetical protein
VLTHCFWSVFSKKLHEPSKLTMPTLSQSRGSEMLFRTHSPLTTDGQQLPNMSSTPYDKYATHGGTGYSQRFCSATATASKPFCTASPKSAVTSGLAVPSIKSSLT